VSAIHPISRHNPAAVADIIFVHGLGGHWRQTWAADLSEDSYWPKWLAERLPTTQIWSLEYEANRSDWQPGMSLVEHADQLLEILLAHDLGNRPLLFIAHSLGGLVVKSLLRASCEAVNGGAKQIARSTCGVVFFATPNSGSQIASRLAWLVTWLGPLGQLYRVSSLVHELQANSPELLKLNRWYRDRVSDTSASGLRISTKVFYEKRGLVFGLLTIVDESSADPGIGGTRPIPMAQNHLSICKLINPTGWEFESIVKFIMGCIGKKRPEEADSQQNSQKIIELAFKGYIPSKIRLEIDSTFIANNNVTVLLTHSDGEVND